MTARGAEPEPALSSVDATFSVGFTHRVRFTSGVFEPGNSLLGDMVAAGGQVPARVLVCVDQGVLDAWPHLGAAIAGYARAHQQTLALTGPVCPVPGGEQCKNDRAIFDGLCRQIYDARLCRQSFVVAIGGGAVLDAVGFATAVAHRGVRLIRVPSTTLAQGDSGVGVKNAINAFGRKNYLGSFTPPWAVLNDERLLTTLSDEQWRSGFSEAVKVAVIKDAEFFAHLAAHAPRIRERDLGVALPVIRRCAQLHIQHIVRGGDPFELGHARPLDFGHWSAHKLEQMTGYRLSHGHAVAIGVALDSAYAALQGMLTKPEADAIIDTLGALGLTIFDPALCGVDLWQGLEEFREHLGGRLSITLPQGLGGSQEVNELDRSKVAAAIEVLGARSASAGRKIK
jgi:3-dehydroquinate synthase